MKRGPLNMKPERLQAARGRRGPGGRPGCAGGHRHARSLHTGNLGSGRRGSAPARPRPCPRGRRASAGAPAARSSGRVIVTFRSGSTCSSSPDSSARQPGSSSIRSLATTTAGRLARSPERTRIEPRALACSRWRRPGRAAGVALEHEQLVHVRVAERPQLGGGDQDDVEREHRQVGGDPGRRARRSRRPRRRRARSRA